MISLLVALPTYLAAQRMGFSRMSGPSFGQSSFGQSSFGQSSFGQSGGSRFGPIGRAGNSYYPLFLDPLYSDYVSSAGYSEVSRPIIFLQAAAAAPKPAFEFPASMQPLLIELQGNSYVQISGDAASGKHDSPAQVLEQVREPVRSASAAELQPQPTVLVFRDGHRLEVSDYTIADGFLYASSDYYRSGSWNQKIGLAVLNLDETVSSNRSRGVTFRLPSAPNVVIVGP
jgi:hypothetical protein